VALRVLGSLGAELHGERRGRAFTVTGVGNRLGRLLLPAVGARAPSATDVRCGALESSEQSFSFEIDGQAEPPSLPVHTARALELGLLVSDADDALAAGDVDAARNGYVTALERAPRHPELSRLVAEIDARVGGRAGRAGRRAASNPSG
jgi:hypothetical protein